MPRDSTERGVQQGTASLRAGTPRLVTIQLSASERIVEHGTRRTTWFVRESARWTSVRDVPGVILEPQSAGPGTVWETLATLALRVGTWLMRVDVTPLPQRFADPLLYLQRERREARRRTRRKYYRVAKDGQLKPAAATNLPKAPKSDASRAD